jgi:hypothetical protein
MADFEFSNEPAWRWWMIIMFVIFFPIVFDPWWMAIFAVLVAFGLPTKNLK